MPAEDAQSPGLFLSLKKSKGKKRAMASRASRLLFSRVLGQVCQFHEAPAVSPPLSRIHFSSILSRTKRGGSTMDEDPSEAGFLHSLNFGDDPSLENPDCGPSSQKPHRPLGRERSPTGDLFSEQTIKNEELAANRVPRKPMPGAQREGFTAAGGGYTDISDVLQQKSPPPSPPNDGSFKVGGLSGDALFEKLNPGKTVERRKAEEAQQKPATESPASESSADEIFKKMKETGLIPNAVAMLDGLCKDGLIQEAMKLFGLMREKRTIPEVMIYTAVVEGFCKATKFDDAKRVFRKMQKNGIEPNAFSYTVLIQGLCKGNRLEDAVEFCMEMLNAGHSPNAATFTGLVDEFCKEKGAEQAASLVRSLRERGFAMDEKAVREHMDKKSPFSPMVWEAIFGKKTPQRPF